MALHASGSTKRERPERQPDWIRAQSRAYRRESRLRSTTERPSAWRARNPAPLRRRGRNRWTRRPPAPTRSNGPNRRQHEDRRADHECGGWAEGRWRGTTHEPQGCRLERVEPRSRGRARIADQQSREPPRRRSPPCGHFRQRCPHLPRRGRLHLGQRHPIPAAWVPQLAQGMLRGAAASIEPLETRMAKLTSSRSARRRRRGLSLASGRAEDPKTPPASSARSGSKRRCLPR